MLRRRSDSLRCLEPGSPRGVRNFFMSSLPSRSSELYPASLSPSSCPSCNSPLSCSSNHRSIPILRTFSTRPGVGPKENRDSRCRIFSVSFKGVTSWLSRSCAKPVLVEMVAAKARSNRRAIFRDPWVTWILLMRDSMSLGDDLFPGGREWPGKGLSPCVKKNNAGVESSGTRNRQFKQLAF